MSTASPPNPTLDGNKVIAIYKDLQAECTSIMNKISELEVERNEHMYVSCTEGRNNHFRAENNEIRGRRK